jgi:hypothetical protein
VILPEYDGLKVLKTLLDDALAMVAVTPSVVPAARLLVTLAEKLCCSWLSDDAPFSCVVLNAVLRETDPVNEIDGCNIL